MTLNFFLLSVGVIENYFIFQTLEKAKEQYII